MMDVNQFVIYQLKNISENRQIRFHPYSVMQERGRLNENYKPGLKRWG